jgi:hypothetical protein
LIWFEELRRNGPNANGQDTPLLAARSPGRSTAGMTFRQSIIGLEFQGPSTTSGYFRNAEASDVMDQLVLYLATPGAIENRVAKRHIFGSIETFENLVGGHYVNWLSRISIFRGQPLDGQPAP